MIGALVLAGGRSRRFGREKALAEIGGEPMIARVVRVLRQGAEQVAVSAREGSLAYAYAVAQGLQPLTDAPGDPDGPLAGVRAGLQWAVARGYAGLVTAPCDAPLLPDDLAARLLAGGEATASVARTTSRLEPLCAYWPASMLLSLDQLSGHPPVSEVLACSSAVEVTFEDAAAFANLNTVEALRSAEVQLGLR